jgi:F0F1-type ATP synthase assembly protein I
MSEHQDPKPSPPNAGDGWRVLSYLIGGVAVYGGIGFGLDRLLGTQFLLPVGIVLGAGLAVLLLHFRYGSRS